MCLDAALPDFGAISMNWPHFGRTFRHRLLPSLYEEVGGKRYLIWQIWDFEGEQYELSMYFVEDDKKSGVATRLTLCAPGTMPSAQIT